MNRKKSILIFYDYFLPGYKAGGPVQSLVNMIVALHEFYDFHVITSAYDLAANRPYDNIHLNQWNKVLIRNSETQVWYSDTKVNYKLYSQVIKNTKADFVFLNCMYSYRYFLFPLFNRTKLFAEETKFIISPRGILQPGSLAVKNTKKKLYLTFLKWTGLLRKCSWHAAGNDEALAIQRHFGNKLSIQCISNIPKPVFTRIQDTNKEKNILRLVHLSLIAPVKNIKTLINVLSNCNQKISLDIFGPVKDEAYWQECQQAMLALPAHISVFYKGDVQPLQVQQTLEGYDGLISLTTGENFGHALFESLSVGRPIITSHFTPWNELEKRNAGWNVDISNKGSIANLLDELSAKTNEEWQLYCKEAHQLAVNYFEEQNFREEYKKLFS